MKASANMQAGRRRLILRCCGPIKTKYEFPREHISTWKCDTHTHCDVTRDCLWDVGSGVRGMIEVVFVGGSVTCLHNVYTEVVPDFLPEDQWSIQEVATSTPQMRGNGKHWATVD